MYFVKTLLAICLVMVPLCAQAKMEVFNIDAQRNAVEHNNRGVIYMQDRYYAPAIKEFQMAVLLDPNTQASSVYYANLANCYMKIGYPALAQDTLQRAIKLNPMNFGLYQDLAVVYKRLGIGSQKIKTYKKDREQNPLAQVMVGMILMEQGKTDEGLAKLQEFAYTEPDLIITKGVQKYIDEHTKEKF